MRRAIAKYRSLSARLGAIARQLRTDRRGVAGIIGAFAAPILIGGVALAIDASMWQVNQRSLQGAADQAAIAGVNAFLLSGEKFGVAAYQPAKDTALAVAKSFGYEACPNPDATYGDACTPNYGATAGQPKNPTSTVCQATPTECLEVRITEKQQHYLSQIVFGAQVAAQARAVATLGSSGGNCVIALDQVPVGGGSPPASAPSFSLKGSKDMTLTDCSIINNLNLPKATDETKVSGTPKLTVINGEVQLAQDSAYAPSGAAVISPKPVSNVSPVSDPYADRTAPTVSGCTFTNYPTITSTSTTTNSANTVLSNTHATYNVEFRPTAVTTPVVFCGGLKATSGSIYLNPGIYIMDGKGFSFSGNGSLYGHGVTIYVTCDALSGTSPLCDKNTYGSIKIDGTAGGLKVDLTPPCDPVDGVTSDPCSGLSPPEGVDGIALWVNKNAPVGYSGISAEGDTGMQIDGLMYAPTQNVTFTGGDVTTANVTCNAIVSLTITMGGGADTSLSQKGCTPDWGLASNGPPRLVE
jgi:Putative Flp pilus-assembly TadE/G-like